MGFFRFKRFLTSARIRVFYVVGLVVIGLLTLFLVFPEGIMDGDGGAVVVGLVIGILGPIPLRLACERGIILGRIDEHLALVDPNRQELPPPTGLIEGSASDMDSIEPSA